MSWLPMAEHQLGRMEAVSSTPEGVKQQMEELKVGHMTITFTNQCGSYKFELLYRCWLSVDRKLIL